jgi:O-antigen/teichoic acid export membrane protein
VLLMYRRPEATMKSDCLYSALFLTGGSLAAYGMRPAAAWAVGALLAGSIGSAWISYRSYAKDPGWMHGEAKAWWSEMRPFGTWAVTGAVIYWTFTQSYNYVLAARLSLGAVAAINASRLLLMPPVVLTLGIGSILVPSTLAWAHEFGFTRMMRRLMVFIVALSAVDFAYFIWVWWMRDWLTSGLLHKTIADRDHLILLWSGVAYIGLLRDVFQAATFAFGHQKAMAGFSAAGALVSLTIMWFTIPIFGPAAALTGQIAGELVNLGCLLLLIRKHAPQYSAQWPGKTAH